MTILFSPPSPQGQAMLQALRQAVAKDLERKRKLGHYAVVWQGGKPVQLGEDAPKSIRQGIDGL